MFKHTYRYVRPLHMKWQHCLTKKLIMFWNQNCMTQQQQQQQQHQQQQLNKHQQQHQNNNNNNNSRHTNLV